MRMMPTHSREPPVRNRIAEAFSLTLRQKLLTAITLADLILPSIEQTIGDGGIGVDSAVAEEGPVAADVFERFQIYVAH